MFEAGLKPWVGKRCHHTNERFNMGQHSPVGNMSYCRSEGREIHHGLPVTVKPVLSVQEKIDKTKVLKTNGSLMKVESITDSAILLTCIKQ